MANKLAEKPKEAETDDAAPEVGKLPTKANVTKLSATVQSIDKKLSSLRGEKGAAIKIASDEQNIHKKAFAAAMKEFGMDPEERANYQRHLAKYRRDLGIELQGDLLKDEQPAKGAAR